MATEFSIFIERIRQYIPEPDTADSFIKEFFTDITDDFSDKESFIEGINSSAAQKWVNGERVISVNVAKKMKAYYNGSKLTKLINDNNEKETLKRLMSQLTEYTSLNKFNNPATLASYILEIILTNIVEPTNARPLNVDAEFIVSHNPVYTTLKRKYGAQLYFESKGICPICSKPLFLTTSSSSEFVYDVAIINKKLDCNNINNLIALCHDHFIESVVSNDLEISMQQAKYQNSPDSSSLTRISTVSIETDIKELLYTLDDLNISELEKLSYEPIPIKNKLKDTPHLMVKVSAYATQYFPYIQDTLKELEEERYINSDILAQAIKHAFVVLNREYDKSTIFNTLVDWLQNQCHKPRECCEIVISYYVQSCEVFYEISK